MTAWEGGEQLQELLAADPEVSLDADQLAACFSLDRIHDSASVVFERLRDLEP
jgi:hypothetical protein